MLSRAHANWAAPAYIAGIVLAVEFGLRWRSALAAAGGAACHAIAGIVICATLVLVPALTMPNGRIVDLGGRFRGWGELGRGVAAALRHEPGMTLLGEQRSLLARLSYYARPVSRVVEWNPGSVVDDQFKLTARLAPGDAGPFLLVATESSPAASTVSWWSNRASP